MGSYKGYDGVTEVGGLQRAIKSMGMNEGTNRPIDDNRESSNQESHPCEQEGTIIF